MSDTPLFRQPIRRVLSRYLRCLLVTLATLIAASAIDAYAAQLGGVTQGPGFTIFGKVRLPDGRPPRNRMKVFVEGMNGLKRDTLSDDDGNYEIRGVSGGRYQVYAINPQVPEQYCDPITADTNRAYSNRLQVDINLKLPLHKGTSEAKPGTVSVAEAAQDIPKPARKAYEDALKAQKENREAEALSQFNQAIELFPEYFQALTERGNVMMQRNQLDEAQADYVRALDLNGRYPPALRGLGYCQIQQKNFSSAVGNLEKAYVLEPNVPLTLLLLGYANLSLDRFEEARQSLQQAIKLGPETAARAHVYLAEVFAHEQKFKEAADEIRAYLKVKPNASDAQHLKELEAKWRTQIKPVKN